MSMKKLFVLCAMMPVLLLSCGKDEGMAERKRPHKAVDLGLSVLWAETNIGAREEYDFGWYFGWGSVVERQASFSWKTYPYAETDEEGKFVKLTKYENYPPYNLDLSDDSARKAWGDGWRMPTRAEVEELLSSPKIEVLWVDTYSYSGEEPPKDEYFHETISGFHIGNKETGERIFLPCALAKRDGLGFYKPSNTKYGFYWTSDISQRNTRLAYTLQIGKDLVWSDLEESYVDRKSIKLDELLRYYGHTIRPVKDRPGK